MNDLKKRQVIRMIKLGRNEQCYCGSNIKYKKCCMDKDITQGTTHINLVRFKRVNEQQNNNRRTDNE